MPYLIFPLCYIALFFSYNSSAALALSYVFLEWTSGECDSQKICSINLNCGSGGDAWKQCDRLGKKNCIKTYLTISLCKLDYVDLQLKLQSCVLHAIGAAML